MSRAKHKSNKTKLNNRVNSRKVKVWMMANASENVCLKWNDFQQNLTSSFKELRTDRDSTDVTLVCGDDQQVKAHKLILKSCSPFFSNIFTRHSHSHPMIYMRGIKGKDVEAILDFIYHGEANIFQEDLNDFLALAEELQIKGLIGIQIENEEPIEEKKVLRENHKRAETKHPLKTKPEAKRVNSENFIKEHNTDSKPLVITESHLMIFKNATKEEVEAKIISLLEKVGDGISNWKCTVCGKIAKIKQNIKTHIETHLEGLSYPCNLCGKVSRTSNGLNLHISTYHNKKKGEYEF